MRSGSGSIEVWSAVTQPNTQSIASRQVTSGSAVVLLDPDVLEVLLEVVLIGPVVDVEPAAGWYFSSESKQPANDHAYAPSATVATSRLGRDRGDRAQPARRLLAEAKDIGATVAAFGARDEPDPRAPHRLAQFPRTPHAARNSRAQEPRAPCHRSNARTQ